MSRGLIERITKAYNYQQSRDELRNEPFLMPEDLTSPMLQYVMERSFLEDISKRYDFLPSIRAIERRMPISWIRVKRIPVHPSQLDEYDLLSKWQCVLSSLHAWKCKTIFMLQRKDGETSLYIGLCTPDIKDGIGQMKLVCLVFYLAKNQNGINI